MSLVKTLSVSSLTAAINDQEYLPGRISSLGLFQEEGITTLTVQIEKDGDTLALVPTGERGTSGLVTGASKRQLIPFNTMHLPQRFTIKAAEIQGIRAFGQASELQAAQGVVNARLSKARRQLDAPHELQRMGALNGLALDADGSTVLLNIYQAFGVEQQVLSNGACTEDSSGPAATKSAQSSGSRGGPQGASGSQERQHHQSLLGR